MSMLLFKKTTEERKREGKEAAWCEPARERGEGAWCEPAR
jgi:hypothetical protein